jgi:hypothetical protein
LAEASSISAADRVRLTQRRGLDAALAVGLTLLSLLGYLSTMRPTFGWGDSSELITAAYYLGVGHAPGYPTWMLIAHPFSHLPIGDVAFRLNFMNALLGSVGVAMLYFLFAKVANSRPAAVIAALTFAFSPTFWDITTETDVFTLHVCFAAAIILVALAWRATGNGRWLYLLSWLFGISLGNHALTVLMIPAVLYLLWAERGRHSLTLRRLAICFALLLIGLSVYAYEPIRAVSNPPPHLNNPHSLAGLWGQLTAPGARESMFDRGLLVALLRARNNIGQLFLKFTWFGSAAALLGIRALWRRDRRLAVFLLLIAFFDVAYSMNFSIFDIYMYYLPLHLAWAAFIAAGATVIIAFAGRQLQRLPAAMLSPHPVWRYGPAIALLMALPAVQFFANRAKVDGSQDYSSERFARAAFKQMEPDALVLADWWTIAPMGYLKYIEGQRKDLIMFAAPSMYAGRDSLDFSQESFLRNYKSIYFVEMLTHRIDILRRKYYLVPEGPVYRVYLDRPAPETVLAADPMPAIIARFGDRVGLVRADLGSGPLRPGECLDLTLYWTPLEGFNHTDHTAALLLENTKDGRLQRIWQESNVLGHDLFPLEKWQPGQVLTEKHRIYLSEPEPTGEYNLYLRVRERGQSKCLDCDRHSTGGKARDYRIGSVKVEQAPSPSVGRQRIPALVAMLRP